MQFYSFCFNDGFGSEMRIYDNFGEYIRVLIELTESISDDRGFATYKFCAEDEEAAYKKARRYCIINGWSFL